MNFFEAQDSARRTTNYLVLLFLSAIAFLLALSNLIVFEFFYFLEYAGLTFSLSQLALVFDVNLSIMLCASIVLFITLGSVYKLLQLSSGGSVIAQNLGGIIIPRSSSDQLHKKILNVVEEMAIASGVPVPQVYVLNEQGINAFAAGWKSTNVVIGITQGALDRLNRDELQAVIAHEFSHIFNGDMRLNIRLVAVLHGILMIGVMGRTILRSMTNSYTYAERLKAKPVSPLGSIWQESADSRKSFVSSNFLAIGVALMVVGYSGTFVGNWIKSLINRQREYLADASAVQYTRNRDGIANALKKIGGSIYGSAMLTASIDEYSHAYFALGDTGFSWFSFSTHPPLKKRILQIEPRWDGKYLFDERKPAPVDNAENKKSEENLRKKKIATSIITGAGVSVAVGDAMGALDTIGEVTQQRVDAAHAWHIALSDEVKAHAENPYGAQALVLALLIDKSASIEDLQYSVLNKVIGELHTNNVKQVKDDVAELARTQTLSLIDLTLPTLREMTVEQYQRFKLCVQQLVEADKKVELSEWIIQRVVLQHLDEHYGHRKKSMGKYVVLGSAKYASEFMLSLLAYLEHKNPQEALRAFDGAKHSVKAGALNLLPKEEISLDNLNDAMDELEFLKPPIKKRFLQACVSCISHDGKVTIQAYELTRAIASCLDCPMPPVLVDKN